MLKKIISVIFLVTCLICLVCVPMSAIMIICKLCNAAPLSWIGCCLPLIIAIAVTPLLFLSKILLDK